MSVEVESKAPESTLFNTDLKETSLREFQEKKVVLAFFPGVFTSVCTKEMCTFRDSLAELNRLKAQVIGISVDGPFLNKAFSVQNRLNFSILSDCNREAIKKYDIVLSNFVGLKGYDVARRAVYILDRDGVVRCSWVSDDPGKEQNYGEVREAVEKID